MLLSCAGSAHYVVSSPPDCHALLATAALTTHLFHRSPRAESTVAMRQRLPARMAKTRAVLQWVERCYGIVPTTINFLDLLHACHEVGNDAAAAHAVSIIRHMQVWQLLPFYLRRS